MILAAVVAAALVLGVPLSFAVAPTVTVENASNVGYVTAQAKGHIDAADHSTFYLFEYATQAQFEESEWAEAEVAGTGNVEKETGDTPVEGPISGLHPNTTYHLRLFARNDEGEPGEAIAPSTFTTLGPVTPPTVLIDAPSGVTTTEAHFVGHVNPNSPEPAPASPSVEAAFESHWHFECTPECPGLEGTVPADNTSHEVSATATGLAPGQAYEVSLVATNGGGEDVAGPEAFTTAAAPPQVTFPFSTQVGATEARLNATVDPGGASATFHFEYLTDSQFQAEGGFASPQTLSTTEAPVIGPSHGADPVAAIVSGLTPGTTYRFRVTATNSSAGNPVVSSAGQLLFTYAGSIGPASTNCPQATEESPGFRPYLLDCRAYELVTPPFKAGYTNAGVHEISSDGESLSPSFLGAFSGGESTTTLTTGTLYDLNRSSSGWVPTNASPLAAEFPGSQSQGVGDVASGQSLWVLRRPSDSYSTRDLYLRQADGAFTLVGPELPPSATGGGPGGEGLNQLPPTGQLSAASADLHTATFMISSKPAGFLWPGDTTVETPGGGETSYGSLYAFRGAAQSEPELVGVSNEGPLDGPEHLNEGADLISQCGTRTGGGVAHSSFNAVSQTGEYIFFTPEGKDQFDCGGTQPAVQEIYARVNGAKTVLISGRSPGDCSGACITSTPRDANFEGASLDGKRVYFTSTQQLTDSAIQDPNAEDSAFGGCNDTEGTGCNLYMYEFGSTGTEPSLTDISTGDPAGPHVAGVMSISRDGSHIYFVSKGVLATNAGAAGSGGAPQHAEEGAENMYVFEKDAQTTAAGFPDGRTRFIAGLVPADSGSNWTNYGLRQVDSTPDGRYLVFSSRAHLTPDDTSEDPTTGEDLAQLFEFDSRAQSLVRISRGQNGFNDDGNIDTEREAPRILPNQSAVLPLSISGERSALTVSADGHTVVFASAAALTAQVQNAGCVNAYAYHSGEAIADGEVSLISDGQDIAEREGSCGLPSPGGLEGAPLVSEDARFIYFESADRLTPQDTDTQVDLYAATVDGGFPGPNSPAACSGQACHSQASPIIEPNSATEGPDQSASATPVRRRLTKALQACRRRYGKATKSRQRRQCESRAKRHQSRKASPTNDGARK